MINTELTSIAHKINHPIAIIDSGVGGLSIMKTINAQLPSEALVYVADTAFAPYGEKSTLEIVQRVNIITAKLLNVPIKALVVACNTATVNAIDQLRTQYPSLPIIGVEPAIKPAVKLSCNKKIGLLVTQATAVNPRFLALVKQHSNGADVIIQACPGLVQLIEQGLHNSPQCFELLRHYLTPLMAQQIDTLVLGCTHYPFLADSIHAITGTNIALVETAEPVGKELQRRLINNNLLAKPADPNSNTLLNNHLRFFTTASSCQQAPVFDQLWQAKISLEYFAAIS